MLILRNIVETKTLFKRQHLLLNTDVTDDNKKEYAPYDIKNLYMNNKDLFTIVCTGDSLFTNQYEDFLKFIKMITDTDKYVNLVIFTNLTLEDLKDKRKRLVRILCNFNFKKADSTLTLVTKSSVENNYFSNILGFDVKDKLICRYDTRDKYIEEGNTT